MWPKPNLTCIMSRQIHIWNFNSVCRKMTKKSPENEIFAKGNNSCKSRSNATKVELDLYYVKTNSYIWNFNSICQKMTKKSLENEFFAKGNNSCKSRSNATKVKLDLYYVQTNIYTKFQVNISKDDWEKFGKPSGQTLSGLTDWRMDRQTEWQTARKPIVPPTPPPRFHR